jgi:diadenosine tetraphosphate (Ap4A) HIT family hydrolase
VSVARPPEGEGANCPLCDGPGGRVVFQAPRWRLVHAGEPGFPAFYRVVWQAHVREFSQLPRQERMACMDAVTAVEGTMLRHLQPDKVNLAALGNVVPHLHWHVIGRFAWDSHFPAPVWAQAQRADDAQRLQALAARLPALEAALVEVLGRLG